MLFATLALYISLAFCGLVIGAIVLRYDLHEQEPWYMVALASVLGAGFMWLAGEAQVAMIMAVHESGRMVSNLLLAVMAGTTEELGKFLVVVTIALASRRYFNEPLDGLLYGSFAGLGAALEESVSVLRQLPDTAFLPAQEPVRLAGHLVMGGIGGFGGGLLRARPRGGNLVMVACLAGAMALHTVWDIAAFASADHFRISAQLKVWHTAVPIGLMLLGMVAFRSLVGASARVARGGAVRV